MKVTATLLWEACHCWRLWHLLPKLVKLMPHLVYTVPLVGGDTDFELHCLLDKISKVDWDSVLPHNSSGSFRRRRFSLCIGRSHSAAGAFVCLNLWTSTLCSPSETRLTRQCGSQISTPEAVVEHGVDPRAENVCPRLSAASYPHAAIQPSTRHVKSPASRLTEPASPTNPLARLRSQPAPSQPHLPPLCPAVPEAPSDVVLPGTYSRVNLSVRVVSSSNVAPTPRPTYHCASNGPLLLLWVSRHPQFLKKIILPLASIIACFLLTA